METPVLQRRTPIRLVITILDQVLRPYDFGKQPAVCYRVPGGSEKQQSTSDDFQVDKIVQDIENLISAGCDGLVIWLPPITCIRR